jgi:hypothetical protein
MPRVLNDTVWIDDTEYLAGTVPPPGVASRIGDHLWEEVGVGDQSPAANVDVDRMLNVARRAFDEETEGDGLDAAVRAVLTELGFEVGAPAFTDESQPQSEEQGPSQFEAVPVTEGGPAVEPAEDLPPAGTVDEGAPESPTPVEAEPAATSADEGDQDVQPAEPVDVEVPNRGGKGSSKAHWLEYARAMGVEVTDDMERHEVIAACEAAGVPVD